MRNIKVVVVLLIALAMVCSITSLVGAPSAYGTPKSTQEPRDHKGTPDPCVALGNCGPGDHGRGNPTKAVPNCHALPGEPDVCKTKPTSVPTHAPQSTPTNDPPPATPRPTLDTPPTIVSTPRTQRTPLPTPRVIGTPYKYVVCQSDVVVTTTVTTTTTVGMVTTVMVTQTVSLYRYQSGAGQLVPKYQP